MIVTLLLSRRFTATESWAVQLSGLRGSMMSRLPENITANGVGLSKSQYNRDIVKRIGDSFDATIYDMIECCL